MRNYVKKGDSNPLPAPADLNSGDFVVVGSLTGVAQGDALAGEVVEVVRSGVFKLPKLSAQAWAIGDKVYWDVAEGHCTTAETPIVIGAAVAAAINPSATGVVRLDGIIR